MANNKMLIDASHPEETRVVVVRGNRIEEFDFEAQERRQLRGNIYLAKVTRVEPSLQAAFIDYGGNRHGFLAFSEIHPDYYQIPAADRQALLEAEAAAASAEEAQEDEDIEGSSNGPEQDEEDRPAKKSRRKPRRSRSRKTKSDNDGDEESAENEAASENTEQDGGSDDDADDATDEDEDDGKSRTIAAAMDIDSISEPVDDAGDDDGEDDSDSASTDGGEPAASEDAPKKKRRTRAAKKTTAKAKVAKDEPESEDEAALDSAESESKSDDDGDNGSEEKPTAKPKRTRKAATRRKPASKKAKADKDAVDDADSDATDDEQDANGDTNGDANGKVESVGQEDALEEVPVRRPRRQYKIQEVIRRRQVMLVQVVKEERGNKGAALTTYLSLAGRYSVLMPNTARGGGISRKITNPSDRKRLKEVAGALDVPKGMGVILRTAGASRDKEEINRDFDYLMRLWENVRNLTLESSAPFLVYEEGSLIKRSIRDLYNKDIGEIIVSGEAGYREAKDFMQMLMPSHSKNVKFYNGDQPLLSKYNIESQLDKMVTPQVTLKSGGYLVINQTEALVAIDVNSGRSTREHSIEATALQTNLEAAEEVARQLRLRDLAGLIVIDFIDMEEKRNNRSVERKLKDCLKNDRARIQVGHISHFGLMEMSRQRMRASVLESTMAVCPVCAGVGHVRSDSSLALHIVRSVDDHLNKFSRNDVTVKTAASIAMYILNHKRQAISELEDRYGVNIAFVTDHSMESQEFNIEKGPEATRTPKVSKAVNPMDFETDDDAAETQENDAPDSSNEDDGGDGRQRKGRRRRSRGRNRNKDRDDNGNESRSEEAVAETESAETESEPEETGKNEKPKRAKKPAKAAVEVEVEETPSEPAEPRRRTGRPGKKVKTEESATESDAVAEETSAETAPKNGAPPRPVRARNTRRVAAKKPEAETAESEDDGEPKPAPEAADEPVVEDAAVADAAVDDNSDGDAGEKKKKKKGSWGFFR